MTQFDAIQVGQHSTGNLHSFEAWLEGLDKTRATGYRWRKLYPWLEVVNVFGRLYVTKDSIAEFERRAIAGELSMTPTGAASRKKGQA